jgi:hypothetical protein
MKRADVRTCGMFVRPSSLGGFKYGLRLPVWQTTTIQPDPWAWAGYVSHLTERVLGTAPTFREAYDAAERASKEPQP